MQPNIPQNNYQPEAPQQCGNTIAPQDMHKPEKPHHPHGPAMPGNQMPANTIAPQDMHKPEKPKKKKNRFRRFVRGYLMLVGLMPTFAALVYGLIVLLETFFPLS